ncbi:hypothetical protein Ahy_A06g027307 [Arachis hypogaea]|uniref:Uncharacterized protein n=1 Tax=Arachis hypogaea TaxID=3818 RepID=A0A445CN75_ARAHY|nr:hypothetical protein Ahy_A06g027307 [Arachis hypogaea]
MENLENSPRISTEEEEDLVLRSTKKIKTRGEVDLNQPSDDMEKILREKEEDYSHALMGGPWMVVGHYLIFQRCRPFFLEYEKAVRKIVAWIRIPNLPIELYNLRFLWREGAHFSIGQDTKSGSRYNVLFEEDSEDMHGLHENWGNDINDQPIVLHNGLPSKSPEARSWEKSTVEQKSLHNKAGVVRPSNIEKSPKNATKKIENKVLSSEPQSSNMQPGMFSSKYANIASMGLEMLPHTSPKGNRRGQCSGVVTTELVDGKTLEKQPDETMKVDSSQSFDSFEEA